MTKYTLFSLTAGTALLLAAGCGKSESPTAEPDRATKVPAPEATPKKVTETPAATNRQTAISAMPEAASAVKSAPASAVAPASVPTNVPAPKPAPAVAPATNSAVSTPAGTQANSAPGAASPTLAQLTLAQTATNQIQALAAAATNQFRGLAAAATNQVGTALAMTNQSGLLANTNQIPVLLEKARVLTSNQKYQDALDTLAQLYNTKLTPEQQQKAEEINRQIQAGLLQKAQSEASSALGNFLGGKK
jgi:hypothetical protein